MCTLVPNTTGIVHDSAITVQFLLSSECGHSFLLSSEMFIFGTPTPLFDLLIWPYPTPVSFWSQIPRGCSYYFSRCFLLFMEWPFLSSPAFLMGFFLPLAFHQEALRQHQGQPIKFSSSKNTCILVGNFPKWIGNSLRAGPCLTVLMQLLWYLEHC